MRVAMTLILTGHKDRRPSVNVTGPVVTTGSTSGQLFLTTDRHSYYRYQEAGAFGLTGRRPKLDWPVPAHAGPTMKPYLGQRCHGRWLPQRRGSQGPRLRLSRDRAAETGVVLVRPVCGGVG
jgi:hypothetical protein